MRTLSPLELLQIWEQSLGLPPVDRAVALLETVCGDVPECDPSEFSIGERDRQLLTLRERTFGPEIRALARCPSCNQPLELQFRVDDVRLEPADLPRLPLTVSRGDYAVKFRLPTSNDLRQLQEAAAAQQLLRLCVLEARCQGAEIEVERLPSVVVDAVVESMAQADPQAEIELSLDCFDCQHRWQQCFDIESFFWAEVRNWAERTLREIHQLASAYGWTEQEIVAVSPLRRSLYLNLIAE
jgi:hypothetical protein